METPDWADVELSRELPKLRSRGESQELEFKSEFPSNARDLGKEIAAFATSNSGTVLLGIGDSGELLGLSGCETQEGRDETIERLAGIAKGSVRPSITPSAKFVVEGGCIVLAIVVPKGPQPLYYCNNVPYVRHLTQARPAEPHEVIELVASYLRSAQGSDSDEQESEESQLQSELARILSEVLVVIDEAEDRQFNPWIGMWRSDLSSAANELRDLAILPISKEAGLRPMLRDLADRLDAVAQLTLYLGSGNQLIEKLNWAGDLVRQLAATYLDEAQLSEASVNQMRELIRRASVKLEDLHRRASALIESGRINDLQSEASAIAEPLTRIARYNLAPLGKNLNSDLQRIARSLHLVETMPLYMDGGKSQQAIFDRVEECNRQLEILSAML